MFTYPTGLEKKECPSKYCASWYRTARDPVLPSQTSSKLHFRSHLPLRRDISHSNQQRNDSIRIGVNRM